MITLIYSIDQTDDLVKVTAVIEESRLVYAGGRLDPPEYGPGLCESSFYLEEGETLPDDEDELIDLLESMDLDWELVSDEDI